MIRAWALAGVLTATPAVAFAAPEPIALPLQGRWEINYDTDACHLDARFGSGNNEVIARLTRFQPGAAFDLTLVGRPMSYSHPFVSVKLGFGAGSPPQTVAGNSGSLGGKPMIVLLGARLGGAAPIGAAQPLTPAQEAAIDRLDIEIVAAKKRPVRLGLGPMNVPMAAMRSCVADLERSWGYDPGMRTRLRQGPSPVGNPNTWVRDADYPSGANFVGNNGLVTFRLDVKADGAIGGCRVLFRTDPDRFADTTCRLLSERARFNAALDAAGTPVPWYYINRVRWVVPLGAD